MNYQIPQPGETWTHRRLPEYMSAQVLEVADDTVVYIRRSVAGGSSHETQTGSTIHQFVQNYQFSPESPNDAGDEVAAAPLLGHGGDLTLDPDLDIDPPPREMWGVPT